MKSAAVTELELAELIQITRIRESVLKALNYCRPAVKNLFRIQEIKGLK
jgi:hypothetical protein